MTRSSLFCRRLFIALLASSLVATPLWAQDVEGSADHPMLTRFAGASIDDYQTVKYDETQMPVAAFTADGQIGNPPAGSVLTLHGKITRINYQLPNDVSTLEVMRNYEQALGDKFTPVFSCAGQACGMAMTSAVSFLSMRNNWRMYFSTERSRYLVSKRATADGDLFGQVYVMQEDSTGNALAFVQVVEPKMMTTGQVSLLDAAAMQSGLESAGRVAIYGVHFDTGKAEVKPESTATLDEMAKLLAMNPGMKVYIVGHTDNVGALAGNLDLSQRRAQAVVQALSGAHKIDAARLQAKGVASLAPVASNADEAGRAKNRRVELVVQ